MRKIIASTFMTLATLSAFAAEPDADSVEKAQKAAQSWLDLVDANQYAATWDQAARPFQAAIDKAGWEQAVTAARSPAGHLEKRVLMSASYSEQLPGAPAGQYVVIQYKSQFSNKQDAIETITPMKDADGTWRVAGYFIK